MRMNRPSRSNSPVSEISAREMDTWSRKSFFSATRRFEIEAERPGVLGQIGDRFLERDEHAGLPYCVAPRTRNSRPNIVFPAPAPPLTSVGRPRGRPPPVISSRPWMPVRVLRSLTVEGGRVLSSCHVRGPHWPGRASRWPRASGEPGGYADPAVGRRESRRPESRASASAPGPARHGRRPVAIVSVLRDQSPDHRLVVGGRSMLFRIAHPRKPGPPLGVAGFMIPTAAASPHPSSSIDDAGRPVAGRSPLISFACTA